MLRVAFNCANSSTLRNIYYMKWDSIDTSFLSSCAIFSKDAIANANKLREQILLGKCKERCIQAMQKHTALFMSDFKRIWKDNWNLYPFKSSPDQSKSLLDQSCTLVNSNDAALQIQHFFHLECRLNKQGMKLNHTLLGLFVLFRAKRSIHVDTLWPEHTNISTQYQMHNNSIKNDLICQGLLDSLYGNN